MLLPQFYRLKGKHTPNIIVGKRYFVVIEYIGDPDDEKIITIPEADFLCFQIDLNQTADISETLAQLCEIKHGQSIIIANTIFDGYRFGSKQSEIQIRCET